MRPTAAQFFHGSDWLILHNAANPAVPPDGQDVQGAGIGPCIADPGLPDLGLQAQWIELLVQDPRQTNDLAILAHHEQCVVEIASRLDNA